MKFEILRGGTFVPEDAEGHLMNEPDGVELQEEYREAIPNVVDAYRREFQAMLHSVYLRGSVAHGRAILNFSDCDCVALLTEPPAKAARARMKRSAAELQARWPFVSQFDLTYFTTADLFDDPQFDAWQFALKIQSRWLFGTDVRPLIRPYRPDFEIAFSLRNLENRLAKFDARVVEDFSAERAAYWCSWIMRTLVRCGMELVIDRVKKSTNQLALCYEVFAHHYPERGPLMREALELAVNPITHIARMRATARELGEWMVAERRAAYGV